MDPPAASPSIQWKLAEVRARGGSGSRHRDAALLPVPDSPAADGGRQILVPADLNAGAQIRAAAAEAARKMGFSEMAIADIELAVGEAVVNAAKHGSPNGAGDPVAVRFYPCEGALIIEVTDRGPGFDLEPVRRLSPACLREGGRGIFLIRSLMDHADFVHNQGTTVRMTKRLVPHTSG